MISWYLHTATGQYIGESKAIAPQVAFCQCMLVLGNSLDPANLEIYEMDDGTYAIPFDGLIYVLRPSHAAAPQN